MNPRHGQQMHPFDFQLYKDVDLILQQDLAPAHTAKAIKSWFNDHGVTVPDSPDMNTTKSMRYCKEEDARHQTQ